MEVYERPHGIQAVCDFVKLFQSMLDKAREIKKTDKVNPVLQKAGMSTKFEEIDKKFPYYMSPESRKQLIDAAARTTFNNLLASTTIDSPSFVNMWNLLDIISFLSDDEQTEPGLLFWLVEELLDSQTIAGCRKVFDYLESRRETITAKHFQSKNLIILRSCNELLRRLSRAEDTAFCGRVFIFLFQSFPLGDKSSVNLRGEYHSENVTTFDVIESYAKGPEQMQLDNNSGFSGTTEYKKEISNKNPKHLAEETSSSPASHIKSTKCMGADQLYPLFWSLQKYFSQPKKLFDKVKFSSFQIGLEATMAMFKSVQKENSADRQTKSVDESRKSFKRKRGLGDDGLPDTFNPKYLTSRDLFELEISDLLFRRHILVQSLIVLDFLLSLSSKSKEKLAKATIENQNKSVMYTNQILSEDDANWVLEMKKSISDYLKLSQDGPFFYRMVETVLSRDKNWARWKIENCPSIARPAITPQDFSEAKSSARKVSTNKRLRQTPIGSFDLKFLTENESRLGLKRLKCPSRFSVPAISSFKTKIEVDDMDLFMSTSEEEKNQITQAKASKAWRALRVASATKLVAFDKIERSDKIDDIFKDNIKPEEVNNGEDEIESGEDFIPTKNLHPFVIAAPNSRARKLLFEKLRHKYSRFLGFVSSHTTRAPRDYEVNGKDYYFITGEEFKYMRDSNSLIEWNRLNGSDYGTSRKALEAVIAQAKVPVIGMESNGIQQLKDKEYPARFIFFAPSGFDDNQQKRNTGGRSDSFSREKIEFVQQEIERSQIEGFYDLVLINENIDTSFKKLVKFVLGVEESSNISSPIGISDLASNFPITDNMGPDRVEKH